MHSLGSLKQVFLDQCAALRSLGLQSPELFPTTLMSKVAKIEAGLRKEVFINLKLGL